MQASETLLKTTVEIALIGSRGLDAVRLTTRWTDQVYVIHELPVGRDGDFGETPLEAQQDLTPYNPYVWEVRRPLDLVMVIAFIGQCSTLAPLL